MQDEKEEEEFWLSFLSTALGDDFFFVSTLREIREETKEVED